MPNVKGGPARPVAISTRQPVGKIAIPVYGYTAGAAGAPKIEGGPATPVVILTAADLVQNGGRYTLIGDPSAMPVVLADASYKVEGGPPIAIFPLNAAGGWPPVTPPSNDHALLLENGFFLLLENGGELLLEG